MSTLVQRPFSIERGVLMYHAIVRSKLRDSFAQVNKGNYDAIVRQFAPGAEHWFSGSHALAGHRTTPKEIQAWYERLATVLPDLRFEITNIAVQGWPWNTVAFVEWVDYLTDRTGQQYSNRGVHALRLAWGKIESLRIYCDTELLSEVLSTLGDQGVEEAVAAPIGEQAGAAH